jgi:phosphomannomutase
MSVAFGTSGLRGLVTALTDDVVQAYTRAFVASCPLGSGLFLGQDLRASSPRIARMVAQAARACGVDVTDCGALPTPALALAAMAQGAGAIMVTGSHIPDDRNGLKFYTPQGEISKDQEIAIAQALHRPTAAATAPPRQGQAQGLPQAGAQYIQRYRAAYGAGALAGLRLGIYQHSSVARDLLMDLIRALGGQPIALARTSHFIPVDTEALGPQTRSMLANWAADLRLDAILSTDGDADRPMLADHTGRVIAGDILGSLTAQALGADVICTPISSNSMIESLPGFSTVMRCKIGSPHVIAAMQQALAADPTARVVGFEANGGFLLGFTAKGPHGPLPPLMTRDAALPLIAPLAQARALGHSLAQALAALPRRVTAADRLTEIPPQASAALLAHLADDAARAAFVAPFGQELAVNHLDGLRLTLTSDRVLHLRPSGNAPEFRIYVEAQDDAAAQALLQAALHHCANALHQKGAQP